MGNNWTDAQAGRAIVFTPRPSDSGFAAVIEDVQFINNIIRNVGSGMLLLGRDEPPAPTDTRLRRMRIANNLFENINGSRFGSNGAFLTVINGTEDVTIEHNTAIQTGNIIIADYAPNSRFVYRDNILATTNTASSEVVTVLEMTRSRITSRAVLLPSM